MSEVVYSDKRQHLRHRRRFSLRFDDGNGNGNGEGRLAFTEDISRKGLFIKTTSTARPGSNIQVAITLPGGEVRLEGRVMWAKKVQPAFLNRVNKAGMGVSIIRFLAGEGAYMALCDELEVS
jgi:hypothetical protein